MRSLTAETRRLLRPFASRIAGSVHGARTDEPLVSLTFDDGPDERETPRLLAALADHGARATFFVISERARRFPELTRTIRAAGHEVGAHADVHDRLTGIPLREVASRIRRAKREIEGVLGEPVRLFRPPYGYLSRRGYLLARISQVDVVAWTVAAEDWLELPVEALVGRSLGRLEPGGILLLHERYEPLPVPAPPPSPTFDREELLRALLDEIAVRGWSSVTVSELLDGRTIDRRLWFRTPAPIREAVSGL